MALVEINSPNSMTISAGISILGLAVVIHYDKRDVKDINALVSWVDRNSAKELIKKTLEVVTYLYAQLSRLMALKFTDKTRKERGK